MKRFFSYSIFGTIIVFIFGGFVLLNRLMEYRSDLADLKDEGFPIAIADLELTPEVGQADATKQFSRLIGPLGSFEAEMYEVYILLTPTSVIRRSTCSTNSIPPTLRSTL